MNRSPARPAGTDPASTNDENTIVPGSFTALNCIDDAAPHRTPANPNYARELLDRARAAKAVGWTEQGMRYGPNTDAAVADLARASAALADFQPASRLASRDEALAFWLNLYNAMVIHGAMVFRVRRAMTEVPRFFKRTRYIIGGRMFSLDVIEHGILRQNRGHPLRFFLPQLMPWDSRRSLVLRPMDPRIHFALNCGAASCPPIRHYTAERIDKELEQAAGAFIRGRGVTVEPDGGVLLSRIFRWYARDFGWTRRKQLQTAVAFLNPDQGGPLLSAAPRSIRYAPYDWSFA
ncbi:MAG: DUF547 domain-containing protein [Planctomycetota bacterium]|nr:DUF547 domain-containing protein [Planctomycetota bacterium]